MARRSRGLNTKPQPLQAQRGPSISSKSSNSKKNKRLKVHKGDLVLLGTRMHLHMYGILMKVTDILDKDRVVCEAITPNDEDYVGNQIIVLTREPTGNTKGGGLKSEYRPWIKKVLNVETRIVYKEIEVKPKRVVTSQEELQEVLSTGDDSEHVVVQLPPAKSAAARHPSANKP